MSEEPVKEKKINYWMWSTIILAVVVILFLIGKNKPVVDFKYIAIIVVLYLGYIMYKTYILKLRQPTYREMVKMCINEEYKKGLYLDGKPSNVQVEPLGKDFFGVNFIDEKWTYLIFNNNIVGKTVKSISLLQQESNKQEIQKVLAQKGVTEVIT